MIQTKEQLRQCLAADRECYRDGRRGWRWMLDLLLARERTVIWRYVRLMRRCDYYTTNRRRSPWHALMYLWYQRRHNRRSVELGLIVGCGAFGPGLCIYHTGNIVVNGYSRIGKNCRLHGSNCIGNSHGRTDCPTIGDNVRFGVGAKAFGDIYIADNVTVAAGAVVTRSCYEKGATLAGVPARIIKTQKQINVNKKK